MSLKDFVTSLRAKHPEYDDMPDNELAQKVIQKYPQYQDMVQPLEASVSKGESFLNKVGDFAGNVAKGTGDFFNGMSEGAKDASTDLIRGSFDPTYDGNVWHQMYMKATGQEKAPTLEESKQQAEETRNALLKSFTTPEGIGRNVGQFAIMGKAGELAPLAEMPKAGMTPFGDVVHKAGNEISQIDFKPVNNSEISLTGNELGNWGDIKTLAADKLKEFRKTAKAYYQKNLQGQFVDHPELGKINFTGTGRNETISQAPHNAVLFPKLKEIVQKAKYTHTENIAHPRTDGIYQFHNLENNISLNGNVQKYKFLVGEDVHGNKYYFTKDIPENLNREKVTGVIGDNNIINDNKMNFNTETNQPNEFVHEHGINLNNDTNIAGNQKSVANDIRQAYSGFKNSQVVKINQLSDRIRTLIPDQNQRQGLTLLRDVGGDVNKLKATVGDPRFEPYKDSINSAIDMSENPAAYSHVQEANALLEKYYNETGKAGLSEGFLKDLRNNYVNRIYERQSSSTGKAMPMLDRVNGHIKQRNFETIIDAIDNHQKPATLDSADLLTIHGSEFAKTLANNKLVTALEDAGLGEWTNSGGAFAGDKQFANIERNIPQTKNTGIEVKSHPVYSDKNPNQIVSVKQTATINKEPIFDKSGNQIVNKEIFAVPDWLEKGLKSIAEPNFLNKVDELRAVHKYQGFVKTIDLAMSFFHHFTFVMQSLYQNKFSIGAVSDIAKLVKNADGLLAHPEFNKMESAFVENGGITSKVDQNIDVLSKLSVDNNFLQKAMNLPGAKQFLQLNEKNANFLFGKMQRWLKVTDYSKKVAEYVQKNNWKSDAELINAKRSIAREINAAYGGLNWENIGSSPSMKRVGQLLLLAPDWTYSNIELAKLAFEKSPGGNIARAHYTTALIGAGILTEGLSYLINGHFTDKNPKGYEFEIEVRPGVYVSLFRGGIGDAIKLVSKVRENGIGGVGEFAGGKGSPFLRGLMTAATGRNYFGQKITNNGPFGKGKDLNFLQKSGNYVSGVAESAAPIPFGVKSTHKLITEGNKDPVSYMVVLAGAGRSGKKKEKPTVDYKRIMGIK